MPRIDVRFALRWILCSAFVSMQAMAQSRELPPPLVLYNATVYTVNDSQPKAEAVVAQNGVITYVGTSAEALPRAPPNARRIDLRGQTVLPGLTDAHAHLAGIGFREIDFDLQGTTSLEHLKEQLRDRSTQTKAGDWLVGRGWIESRWTPAVFPTRQDLDSAVSDRAVVLTRRYVPRVAERAWPARHAVRARNRPHQPCRCAPCNE